MKKKPLIKPEFHDGVDWYSLASEYDIRVDDDIYTLLQALNDEVL